MAAANTATDSAPAPVAVVAVPVPACQKKNSEDNAGWMGKFQDFFQTPMEEHKACWKVAVQKMTDELKELKEKSATTLWKTKDEGNQALATEESTPTNQ